MAKRTRRRGEHGVSRKTIARGMPGNFRCDRGDYTRVFVLITHEAAGALGTRHSLRPRCFRADASRTPRAISAARMRRRVLRGCLNLSEPSSPAKAGDPVFRDISDRIEKPRRTGYPACAGYDEEERSAARSRVVFEIRRRHCEERMRPSNPFFLCAARWIASRSLSSGAHSRDPLARNDDLRTILAV